MDEDLAEHEVQVFVGGVMTLPVQLFHGGPVALVQDEERPVPEYLVDQLIEDRHPRLAGHLGRVDAAQRPLPEFVQPHVQRHQDVFLAGEVVVDRRLGETEPLGDLAQ